MERLPYTRRVGAYLFFAVCAFGNSLAAYLPLKMLGLPHWLVADGSGAAMIATFLALRDMTARPSLPTTQETGE